ncbi:hypothetical protein C8R44DRAFT_866256 [Mycena epipterygia]|nr:hypothetical protein C8R44DRAFT_866256 [Mycena epipterygia]
MDGAGLLPALVSIVQQERTPRSVTRILEIFLPSYMVHYSVVAQVELAMPDLMPAIQILMTTQKFPDCLKSFLQAAQDRITIKSNYDSGKYASTQACDNMKCGLLLRKSLFRRCSQCARRYYCSEKCQTVDWREAGHRAVCESLRTSKSDAASTRDRAFMRAVVHHGYESGRDLLFQRQILFMRENPTADFYCLYNFKCFPPTFSVFPLRDLPRTDPVWADCIERTRRSGGRMEVHLVHVPDCTHADVSKGTDGSSRIFPLRLTRADIQTGLWAIAKALLAGVDESRLEKEIEERVTALLCRTRDVVQIHCE